MTKYVLVDRKGEQYGKLFDFCDNSPTTAFAIPQQLMPSVSPETVEMLLKLGTVPVIDDGTVAFRLGYIVEQTTGRYPDRESAEKVKHLKIGQCNDDGSAIQVLDDATQDRIHKSQSFELGKRARQHHINTRSH